MSTNINFKSSESSTICRRRGGFPPSLSMRKRCFPDLPATKCAVWDALLSRKGRPPSKGSYNKQPMEKSNEIVYCNSNK
jgi:hypothetical protein